MRAKMMGLLLCIVATQARAKEAEWWMIGTGKNAEGRTVMFADVSRITGTKGKPRVWVKLVYGPPKALKMKAETIFYEIDCASNTGTRLSTYFERQDGTVDSEQPVGATPLFIPPESTGSFVHSFVCDRENAGAVLIRKSPDAYAAEIRAAYSEEDR
jgi:hypothetical protein